MGKVKVNYLDNRANNLIKLCSTFIFKNLNKELHKSWLQEYSVRGHDRVEKCKIQFKEGIPEFIYSPTWLKSLENESGTFISDAAIDHINNLITTQNSKMKNKRGRKRKVVLKPYSYNAPKVSL